ncbi:transcriptional regulator SlmA [Klebsiella michiganensis]|uniref:Transcriptional regulator SlmA n=1 Tax=Klebsiella michiganensis TaxID=1134687 RepID=A0A7H4PFD6_9ENTR|nr:transcriptional regulator SlmA [Klebsiella michiganensis]
MEVSALPQRNWRRPVGVSESGSVSALPEQDPACLTGLIEFIEDSLITRINLILKDEKDTSARLRLIVLLILGFWRA